MKKFILTILIFSLFSVARAVCIPNPWVDCEDDFSCGAQKAGFEFQLKVKNPFIRAMDGLFEITFPLDKKREVTARKALVYDGFADINGKKDLSGDYNNYPVNKTIYLNNVPFNVRGIKNKFYVVNFATESGYYSFNCEKGLSINDIQRLYKLVNQKPDKKSK